MRRGYRRDGPPRVRPRRQHLSRALCNRELSRTYRVHCAIARAPAHRASLHVAVSGVRTALPPGARPNAISAVLAVRPRRRRQYIRYTVYDVSAFDHAANLSGRTCCGVFCDSRRYNTRVVTTRRHCKKDELRSAEAANGGLSFGQHRVRTRANGDSLIDEGRALRPVGAAVTTTKCFHAINLPQRSPSFFS